MADKLPVSCNNEIFLLPFTVMRKNFVHRILQNLFFSLRLSFAYFVYFCSCYHTTATQLWQHPFVNVFKHFNLQSWKKSTKEGEVSTVMDKTLKCTVYRITGSIPAGNYIQLPKAQSQSLGLTGRYFYLLFKPVPTKYFVVHIDVATQDNLIVRISFSNLFKEFKSTSTWLQFPFLCNASKGSVQAYASVGSKDHSGPAPMSTRWTVLCLDMNYILSMYLNRKFSYIKNVKLCANMLVKNISTSDILYEVGLTFDQAKKAGRLSHDITPMPRDFAFPLSKGDKWDDLYDLIRFPNEGSRKPFDSIQFENIENSTDDISVNSSQRVSPKKVDISKCVSERISLIHNMTKPRQKPMKRIQVTKELPMIGVDDVDIHRDEEGEIHVFAHPTDDVVIHQDDRYTGEPVNVAKVKGNAHMPAVKKANYTALEPDPILKLRRIVGFGGSTFKDALWSVDGSSVIYPCHAVVVAMRVSNGHQRFFIGHTDKVSCISMTGNSTMLASGQTGDLSVVRVWKFNTGECLSMCKTHVHSLHCLSFAHKGNMLCGVGKDNQGKNMVVIWNTSKVLKNREISVTAKAHTDVDIVRLRVSAFDDTRMVSCGRDNIRLWRVKEGQLRSAPVNLAEHHSMEFTDVAFEAGYHADRDPSDRLVYACSRSGHIFEIELQKVAIRQVRRLLPNMGKSKDKDKQTFRSGPGIGLNCISVNETFCVTGSDDGYLRLWPLDFAHVYLEAEHEGPVTAVDFSSDGLHILAGTFTGNLGMLDVTTRSYTTMMRSHTGRITGVAVDPYRKHLATVSEDHTIRVWDSETLQQLYDFSAPSECPCTISYHPSRQIFACGFENGIVRIFNVQTTSMMAEHKQHRGKIIGLAFSPAGDYLFSACSLGSLALYDATADNFPLLRLLANTVARGERRGPEALSVSPDGRRMVFIGPSEFIVSVVDSKSLDEVLRIDISNINTSSDSVKAVLDSAMRVFFTPQSLGHLLVTTANNKLLKFDARTGRILAEVNNIHRSGCSTLTVTDNGRYLATGGDKTIKIWDYNMRLDINFQVFIGHSENVSKIVFTPDCKNLLSVGEAIYMWDFLAVRPPSPIEGREVKETPFPFMDRTEAMNDIVNASYQELPRTPPKPIIKSPGNRRKQHSPLRFSQNSSFSRIEDLSSIVKPPTDIESESSDKEVVLIGPDIKDRYDGTSDTDSVDSGKCVSLSNRSRMQQHKKRTGPFKKRRAPSKGRSPRKDRNSDTCRPTCRKHFQQRERFYGLAQRRYIAPPNQAGVQLKSIIGYNGNARNNLIWQSDTGLFIYTTGCVLIIENLNTGQQKHLTGHTEEISTLSLQNDCQVLASASGSFGISPSQICIWDLQQHLCKKVLNHHEFDVQCLAYSRDDRFLISVGDYRDCSIVVWSTHNYEILTTSRAASPIHELKWDPYTVNEFASVGQNGTVLFWLLDETTTDVCLNVHEAEVPDELLQGHHKDVEPVDFTAMEYAGDSTLYISTSNGKVSAWDTRHNTCFIHWEADNSEIDVIMCRSGRLLTGSVGKNLRVWSIVGVGELKLPGDHYNMRTGGLTMEDEMNLDGPIVTAVFDEALDMGIVGTSSGTLWYINWPERTSIRLVSSHMAKVNNLSLCNSEHFASCADDGSVRVWSLESREQTLQFQVKDQACTCIDFSPVKPDGIVKTTVSNTDSAPVMSHQKIDAKFMPLIAAGYSDGTVRVFDIDKVEMILKMHPHAVSVTAISFSSDGHMVLTGGSDGLIAISSPTTGMTVRVISDHKGAPITNIDVTLCQEHEISVTAPQLWLATSADRRVSVWSADWSKDFCELVDWLTFPAPAFTPDGTVIAKQDQKAIYNHLPPSLAKFSPEEPDIIVYVGYGMEKCIQYYSLSDRKVIRTQALTHWSTCMDLAQSTALVSLGANERVIKLMDYYEGSFQDFVGHSDSINFVKFSPDCKYLLTVSHSEIFIWEVQV